MMQLATEDTSFVALFIKANHFLSDNFHGVDVIVTESVKNPTATHVHGITKATPTIATVRGVSIQTLRCR